MTDCVLVGWLVLVGLWVFLVVVCLFFVVALLFLLLLLSFKTAKRKKKVTTHKNLSTMQMLSEGRFGSGLLLQSYHLGKHPSCQEAAAASSNRFVVVHFR